MTPMTPSLNDLVDVLDDGIGFLTMAGERAREPAHRDLFAELRVAKQAIVAEIRAQVVLDGGEPGTEGTWLGRFRQAYTDLRARLSEDTDASLVSALEQQEDRTLAAFREVAASDQPTPARSIAAAHLPAIQQIHDRLRTLKRGLGD